MESMNKSAPPAGSESESAKELSAELKKHHRDSRQRTLAAIDRLNNLPKEMTEYPPRQLASGEQHENYLKERRPTKPSAA